MWRYDEMLLDKIMEQFPGPVRLTEPRSVGTVMVVCGALLAAPCLLLAYPGIGDVVDRFARKDQILWGLVGAVLGLYSVVAGTLQLRRPHTAVLDADGFRTTSKKGSRWYPWKYVDHFEVVSRGEEGREVDFVLTYPDGGLEDCRFPSGYGLSAEVLTALMTRWRAAALPERGKPGRKPKRAQE